MNSTLAKSVHLCKLSGSRSPTLTLPPFFSSISQRKLAGLFSPERACILLWHPAAAWAFSRRSLSRKVRPTNGRVQRNTPPCLHFSRLFCERQVSPLIWAEVGTIICPKAPLTQPHPTLPRLLPPHILPQERDLRSPSPSSARIWRRIRVSCCAHWIASRSKHYQLPLSSMWTSGKPSGVGMACSSTLTK